MALVVIAAIVILGALVVLQIDTQRIENGEKQPAKKVPEQRGFAVITKEQQERA